MDTEGSHIDDDSSAPPRERIKEKGRGHRPRRRESFDEECLEGRGGGYFESIDDSSYGPVKSVEGWILFVSNVHEEAQEDDILDTFGEFGQVKNIHVNLDRRTGFVKGYALIEFAEQAQAEAAITELNGKDMFGQSILVDWAFCKENSTSQYSRRRRLSA